MVRQMEPVLPTVSSSHPHGGRLGARHYSGSSAYGNGRLGCLPVSVPLQAHHAAGPPRL